MKIIAIVSAKGGVGKTTVCANLSVALRHFGKAVLALDLDPQNALRLHLGTDLQNIEGLSRATLARTGWRHACVQGRSGVYVLPFGMVNEADRQAFERRLDAEPDWLARNLNGLGLAENSLVLVDTPPGPSVYMRQALAAAHFVVVVSLADAASYATLPMMEGLIASYCKGRMGFIDHAYIVNQVDRARQLDKDIVQVTRNALGERVIGLVHQDQSVSEALAYGLSAIDHDPHGQGRQDLLACAQWLGRRLDQADARP
ncbi:cellulose biosynthesis protein BcsQ [Orrella sp. JC864]|uniref:cellulose biosynthesis protein BcsQ n=1 Tax=Orrella sp. JC864 TaxID=3120298 RepID=UPI00300B4BFC